jgi:hypothetical protein
MTAINRLIEGGKLNAFGFVSLIAFTWIGKILRDKRSFKIENINKGMHKRFYGCENEMPIEAINTIQ